MMKGNLRLMKEIGGTFNYPPMANPSTPERVYLCPALAIAKFGPCRMHEEAGREGTLDCLFHLSPKFYNIVFLFVGLTTLGTFI